MEVCDMKTNRLVITGLAVAALMLTAHLLGWLK